jgi:hypothetical protein
VEDVIDLDSTLLQLTGIGVMPYSARGLQQTLEPIDQASNLVRAIDGSILDLGLPQFQKYKSTITGNDQVPPVCDGVWPGRIVEVDCVHELVYPEYGVPQREVVEGSMIEEAGFVRYRPRLTMVVVTGPTMNTDEWAATVGWSMVLEEA